MSIDQVNDLGRRVQYEALAAQDEFDYPFAIFDEDDLVVDVDGVVQIIDTDYEVDGVEESTGGTITFTTPLAGGEIVTMYSDTVIERTTDLQQNGPLTAARFNDEFDRIFVILQELKAKVGRAIRMPFNSETTDAQQELSPISNWIGKFLRVSASGVLEAAELLSSVVPLTQSLIGQLLYPTTDEEQAASVVPVNNWYAPGNPRRQGAPIDGITSARAAFAAQDSTGEQVYVTRGTYLIDSNITLTGNYTFERGAVLKIATGVTLTFTQPSTEKWADAHQIFQIVGTGKVQWSACSPTVLPEWWTTNTTPATTDMTTALERAGDCVVNGADAYVPSKTTGGAGRLTIKLTTKRYRTTAALDWNQRDYLHIISVGKSEILSESTTYIADFSSTYRLHVESVDFISYSAPAGLLFNRCTGNPYCLYVRMDNVNVFVDTDTAANAGQGTYGIVNCRAEQNVWTNCDVRADVPLYMTQYDDANFPPVSGTQDTAITSLVSGTFISCNFLRHTKHNYGAILYGVLDIHFINCYWATVSTASGSNPYAFFVDTISGCTFTGVMEGTERFMFVSKTSYFLKINVTPQAAALDSGGLLNFDSSNATGLVNSEVTFNITSAVSGGKVIRWGGGGPSCQLFNVRVITGDPALIAAYSLSPTNCSAVKLSAETNATVDPTVASAATLGLDPGTEVAYVSGTIDITAMTAFGFARKIVTLIFQGVLTFTDGNNLKLNGNFVTSADDTITLYCDGTNWIEIGRSAN